MSKNFTSYKSNYCSSCSFSINCNYCEYYRNMNNCECCQSCYKPFNHPSCQCKPMCISGPTGPQGIQGIPGPAGAPGIPGQAGQQGIPGQAGPAGAQGNPGPAGAQGAPGSSGGILAAADFYALMPPDNATTIAVGSSVSFPNPGPFLGSDIYAMSNTTFNLVAIGIYLVSFNVSVEEAGQLVIVINNSELANTVVGRATVTSLISQTCLIQTFAPNSVLSINNPTGNLTALTITPSAGGENSVSAHLTITRYS